LNKPNIFVDTIVQEEKMHKKIATTEKEKRKLDTKTPKIQVLGDSSGS